MTVELRSERTAEVARSLHQAIANAPAVAKLPLDMETGEQLPHDERRQRLRRLDDVLEALEQLNLHDRKELPEPLRIRLLEIGIETPEKFSITQLIEKVWAVQQPYLVKVVVERRRRRRRRTPIDLMAAGS